MEYNAFEISSPFQPSDRIPFILPLNLHCTAVLFLLNAISYAAVLELNHLANIMITFRYEIACIVIQLLIKLHRGFSISNGLSIRRDEHSTKYISIVKLMDWCRRKW